MVPLTIALAVVLALYLGGVFPQSAPPVPTPNPSPAAKSTPLSSPTLPPTPSPAPAPTVKLKFAFPTPPTSAMEQSHQWMFDEVEKRTNGRVKCEFHWGGSLLAFADMISGVGAGTADIGYVNLSSLGQFPHWQFMQTVLFGANPLAVGMQVQALYERVPALEADMRKQNLTAIRCPFLPAAQIISKTPLNTIDYLKGKKLRHSGPAVVKAFQIVGAVPVSLPVSDVYEAVQKGVIDGSFFGLDTFTKLSLQEVCKYFNDWGFLSTSAPGTFMNLNTWNRLPKEYQQVILQAGKDANVYLVELLKKEDDQARRVAQAAGVQFLEASRAEREKWASLPAVKAIGTDWVREMEAKGYPATKDIYNLWVDLVAKAQ